MKLVVDSPGLGPNLFADFHSVANGAGRRPLLVYFVGMVGVVEAAPSEAVAGKSFKCFVNDEDPLSEQSERFAALMARSGRQVDVVRRQGGHSFEDFVNNGSAAEASSFAMRGR